MDTTNMADHGANEGQEGNQMNSSTHDHQDTADRTHMEPHGDQHDKSMIMMMQLGGLMAFDNMALTSDQTSHCNMEQSNYHNSPPSTHDASSSSSPWHLNLFDHPSTSKASRYNSSKSPGMTNQTLDLSMDGGLANINLKVSNTLKLDLGVDIHEDVVHGGTASGNHGDHTNDNEIHEDYALQMFTLGTNTTNNNNENVNMTSGNSNDPQHHNFDNRRDASSSMLHTNLPYMSMGLHGREPVNYKAGASKRKRAARGSCKNIEDRENQRMTHIAVERNRRRQMNEHLRVLRALMPPSYVQRGDQASIIGGAIEFVRELEQLLQCLESQKRRRMNKNGNTANIASPRANMHNLLEEPDLSYLIGDGSSEASMRKSATQSNNIYEDMDQRDASLMGVNMSMMMSMMSQSNAAHGLHDHHLYDRNVYMAQGLHSSWPTQHSSNVYGSTVLGLQYTSDEVGGDGDGDGGPSGNMVVAHAKSSLVDIEVKMAGGTCDGDALVIKILSQRRPRQLLHTIAALETDLHLLILHTNVTTIDNTILYSFSVKINVEGSFTPEQIATSVHDIFVQIINNSSLN